MGEKVIAKMVVSMTNGHELTFEAHNAEERNSLAEVARDLRTSLANRVAAVTLTRGKKTYTLNLRNVSTMVWWEE